MLRGGRRRTTKAEKRKALDGRHQPAPLFSLHSLLHFVPSALETAARRLPREGRARRRGQLLASSGGKKKEQRRRRWPHLSLLPPPPPPPSHLSRPLLSPLQRRLFSRLRSSTSLAVQTGLRGEKKKNEQRGGYSFCCCRGMSTTTGEKRCSTNRLLTSKLRQRQQHQRSGTTMTTATTR